MTSAAMPAPTATHLTLATKPRPTAEVLRRLRQRRRSRLWTAVSDGAALTLAAGSALAAATVAGTPAGPDVVALSAVTVGIHAILLGAVRSREHGIAALREYRRVLAAGALTFAVLACLDVFAPSASFRSVLLGVLPISAAAVLTVRVWRRRWITSRRPDAKIRAVVVGASRVVDALTPVLESSRLGYTVVGAAVEHAESGSAVTATAAAGLARSARADVVVVAGTAHDSDLVRRLSWELEGTAASLVLATTLTDVAEGRMSVRTAAGLALVGVRIPTYDGASHRIKRLLDIVCSIAALIPISIVAPLIALAIRLDSAGPAMFRQQRVGCDGREFTMLKFRTMTLGAESQVTDLAALDEGAGALFKVRADPRVTRVGRFLRKYSIDELPQFWNVLRGEMSIVGPRPPLPREVRMYDTPVFRRLYLRPGITGPWQIGGRSDLSWDESVRLDLHYVENWSVTRDLAIMIRTAAVVLRAKGAY